MRGYRPQRNRRKPDPMNFDVGPLAAGIIATYNESGPTITIQWNCNFQLAAGIPTGWEIDEGSVAIDSVEQQSDNQVRLILLGTANAGAHVALPTTPLMTFGPNIVPARSDLWLTGVP